MDKLPRTKHAQKKGVKINVHFLVKVYARLHSGFLYFNKKLAAKILLVLVSPSHID